MIKATEKGIVFKQTKTIIKFISTRTEILKLIFNQFEEKSVVKSGFEKKWSSDRFFYRAIFVSHIRLIFRRKKSGFGKILKSRFHEKSGFHQDFPK